MKKYGRQRITSNRYQLILRKILLTTLRNIQDQVTNIKRKKVKRTNVGQTNQLKKTLSFYQVWLPQQHLLTFRYLLKTYNHVDSKFITESQPSKQSIVQLYIFIMQQLSKAEGIRNNLSLHEETNLGNSYDQLKIPPLIHQEVPNLQKKKDRLKLMGWKNSWTSDYQNEYLKVYLSGKSVQDARRYFILVHKQFEQILNRYRIRDVLANVFKSAFRILENKVNENKHLLKICKNLTVFELRAMVNDPNFKQFRLKLVKFYLYRQTDEKQVQELVHETKKFLDSLQRKKKRKMEQNKKYN